MEHGGSIPPLRPRRIASARPTMQLRSMQCSRERVSSPLDLASSPKDSADPQGAPPSAKLVTPHALAPSGRDEHSRMRKPGTAWERPQTQ